MKISKHVIFKIENQSYGFDILLVNAIEKYEGVVGIPNAPDYILGMVNLRGEITPVFSLRRKFGLPEEPINHKTQLIVTRANNVSIGFKVDAVEEIMEINEEEEIEEIPVIVRVDKTKYARCIVSKKERLIILMDHNGILSEEEHAIADKLVSSHK